MWSRSPSPWWGAGQPYGGSLAEPDRGAEVVPEAANDASRATAGSTRARGGSFADRIRASGPFGWLLLLVALVAAVVLVVADFSELSRRMIGIGACDDRTQAPGVCSTIGHAQHGYALVVLGVLAAVMAVGAVVGRSRAASVAVLVAGAAVLGIALLGDYPDRNDTRGLEARYSDVSAKLENGFKLELVGGVLLLLVGGLALVRPEPGTRRRQRDGSAPPLTIERSVRLARPAVEVFDFVADARNDPQWCSKVRSVELVSPTAGLDASYAVVHKPVPGRPARKMEMTCTAFERPRTISWRQDDGTDVFLVTYTIEALGDRSRLTQRSEATLGSSRLLRPLYRRGIGRDMTNQLEALKKLLEARPKGD
jgi:uncharacterized protein YndB with AHSA1/START domain